MLNKITLYIAISVVVSLGVGYGAGHFVASNKAERDIAAIRTILEEERAEKKSKEEELQKAAEENEKEWEEIHKRLNKTK